MINSGRLLILPLFLLLPLKAMADGYLPTAQFLLEGQGPRAVAMAESAASNSFDYTAWYWNPAAAAFARDIELGFSRQSVTSNITTSYLSFVYPARSLTFGANIISENSTVSAYDSSGRKLPSIDNRNLLASTGLAFKIKNSFAMGFGLGSVSMDLGGYKTNNALNMNIGALYLKNRLSAAVVLANMGGKLKFEQSDREESQPALMRYGISYVLTDKRKLLLSVSRQDVLQNAILSSTSGGMEFLFGEYFALRAGILNRNNYSSICSGFGVFYKHIGIDFSYVFAPVELQGMDTTQLGLSYKFGRQKENRQLSEVKPKKQEQAAQRDVKKPAVQYERINLAVAEFSGRNVSQSDAFIVSDFLRTELVNLDVFNIIEKANMDKILAEAAFQMSGCTTSDCVVKMGKILNVRQMVVGYLAKLTDTYYITVNIVDVESGRILTSFAQDAAGAKDLQHACHLLAQKIAKP